MCTRIVYLGQDDIVVTARSMDWGAPMPVTFWALPAGMPRTGAAGPGSASWTSRYGSVAAVLWDRVTADGMNTAGLVANLLYLTEAGYPSPAQAQGLRPLSVSVWAQYYLDRFATVAEAVAAAAAPPFAVLPVQTPDGEPGQVHLSLSDADGDSAILEYLDGELVVHHDRSHQVMTNSPPFSEQLAITAYWRELDGVMLPGTERAADRFVRAASYIDRVAATDDPAVAVATASSIIRNASVPMGVADPSRPNIAETRWRVAADHRNRRYYFESAHTPSACWVDLDDLDLTPSAEVARLSGLEDGIHAGNAAAAFEPTEMFSFLEVS